MQLQFLYLTEVTKTDAERMENEPYNHYHNKIKIFTVNRAGDVPTTLVLPLTPLAHTQCLLQLKRTWAPLKVHNL